MKSEDFIKLYHNVDGWYNPKIEMEGKTYKVLDCDVMGRVKMRQVVFVLLIPMEDMCVECDTYEEACDQKEDIEEEYMSIVDIEEKDKGKIFWMHYKDIDEKWIDYYVV